MKKFLAILLSVVMLLGCVVISTAAEEPDIYPETAVDVTADGATSINAAASGLWYENNLEASVHYAGLNIANRPDGSQIVNDIRYGDVITYKINVTEAGKYTLSYDFIWQWEHEFAVSIDGGEAFALGASSVFSPDWGTTVTSDSVDYDFAEGEHTIKLTFNNEGGGCHFYALNVVGENYVPEVDTTVEVQIDTNGATTFDWGYTLGSGFSYDYQFATNVGFESLAFFMANFGDNTRGVTAALYKFDTDRETTLASEAIQTWNKTVLVDGSWIWFELDAPAEAGEYILYVIHTAGDVLLYKYPSATGDPTGKGYYTLDPAMCDTSIPAFKVTFTEEVADGAYFAKAGETEPPVEPEEPAIEIALGEKYDLNVVKYATLVEDDWNPTSVQNINGVDVLCNFLQGDYVEYKINVLEAGTYDFAVVYACMWEDSYFTIYVDGEAAGTVYHYASNYVNLETPVWTDPAEIELTEGEHTIKLTFESGCYLWGIEVDSDIPVEPGQTYVYVNSLDGSVLYTGEAPLGDVDAATLAQLNAYANGTYNSFVEFEELSCVNNVHTFYSVHNTEATVTVEGGAKEEKDGYYVLTAGAPAEGQYFAGWYDGDKLISYNETYKFFPDGATESLVAKYAEEAPAKDSKVEVEADRVADKLTVKVTPVYGDNVIVDFGYYVATSAESMTADEVITNGQKLDSHAPHAYMVRVHDILETTKLQNIYIVGYFTYNDGEAIQTITTELVTVASVTSLIDSDTYTYSNTNAPAMLGPETVSGIAGFDGNCLYFNDPDKDGTIWGYYPEGNFGMIKYSFEAGRTYLFSFEYKPGDSWTEGFAPYRMAFGNLFYWNGGYNISQQNAAITFENVCIDEENGIYRCTATFVATENGGWIELGQWGDSFEAYMDNIIMEKIA